MSLSMSSSTRRPIRRFWAPDGHKDHNVVSPPKRGGNRHVPTCLSARAAKATKTARAGRTRPPEPMVQGPERQEPKEPPGKHEGQGGKPPEKKQEMPHGETHPARIFQKSEKKDKTRTTGAENQRNGETPCADFAENRTKRQNPRDQRGKQGTKEGKELQKKWHTMREKGITPAKMGKAKKGKNRKMCRGTPCAYFGHKMASPRNQRLWYSTVAARHTEESAPQTPPHGKGYGTERTQTRVNHLKALPGNNSEFQDWQGRQGEERYEIYLSYIRTRNAGQRAHQCFLDGIQWNLYDLTKEKDRKWTPSNQGQPIAMGEIRNDNPWATLQKGLDKKEPPKKKRKEIKGTRRKKERKKRALKIMETGNNPERERPAVVWHASCTPAVAPLNERKERTKKTLETGTNPKGEKETKDDMTTEKGLEILIMTCIITMVMNWLLPGALGGLASLPWLCGVAWTSKQWKKGGQTTPRRHSQGPKDKPQGGLNKERRAKVKSTVLTTLALMAFTLLICSAAHKPKWLRLGIGEASGEVPGNATGGTLTGTPVTLTATQPVVSPVTPPVTLTTFTKMIPAVASHQATPPVTAPARLPGRERRARRRFRRASVQLPVSVG